MDFSEWLATENNLEREEADWARVKPQGSDDWQLDAVREAMQLANGRHVLEVGCATGWLPYLLNGQFESYQGLDACHGALSLAVKRNQHLPNVHFEHVELRKLSADYSLFNVICCFSTLKHFSPSEWLDVFARLASLVSKKAVLTFNMSITNQNMDNRLSCQVKFIHAWVNEQTITEALRDFIVHSRRIVWEGSSGCDVPSGKDELFVVSRRN